MITLFAILVLGFFLGMRHATDSDHVVAVTTIVSRQRNIGSAALTGLFWGLGHSLTLLVVGGGIILFGIVLPERVGMSLEFCVSLMLILLGIFNLRFTARELRNNAQAKHQYEHAESAPMPAHRYRAPEEAAPVARLDHFFGGRQWYRGVRPLIIGVVHGLAGSATVALLVLPIIQRPIYAIAYLGVFGVGTIIGMMLMTATIAVPITYASRFPSFHRHFGTAAGVLNVGFGIFLAYEIGFVNGLFTR